MSKVTRRELHKMMVGGFVASAMSLDGRGPNKKPNLIFGGVQIGVQSWTLRKLSLDAAIEAMREVGLSSCELWDGHVEPREADAKKTGREALRQWRLSVPLSHFTRVRDKFERANINLTAYTLSLRDDFTDAEMERGFEMAKALGVSVITASSNPSAARRIDGFASNHKIYVGLHNHSKIESNEFATPDDFARALQGASKYLCINLDIGHFAAAGFDSVKFIREHHAKIVSLHIKDRESGQGANTVFGKGDAPVREVLTLLKQNRWRIPANIEHAGTGGAVINELKECLAYCKQSLGG